MLQYINNPLVMLRKVMVYQATGRIAFPPVGRLTVSASVNGTLVLRPVVILSVIKVITLRALPAAMITAVIMMHSINLAEQHLSHLLSHTWKAPF